MFTHTENLRLSSHTHPEATAQQQRLLLTFGKVLMGRSLRAVYEAVAYTCNRHEDHAARDERVHAE